MDLKTVIFFLILSLNIPHIAWSSNNTATETITIEKAIELSLKNSELLKEKKSIVNNFSNIKKRIKGEFNPKVNITFGAGPINKETGNSINSQKESSLGPIFLGSFKLTYPIWTWGKKSDLLQAASFGKDVEKENVEIEKLDIIYNVKKFFYGNLLAKTLLKFAEETRDEVLDIIKTMKEKKASKEDRYRIEILASEIKTKIVELKKKENLTIKALNFFVGRNSDKLTLKTDKKWLEFQQRPLEKEQYYLDLANNNLPQLHQIKSGIKAKSSLLSAEKKSKYPLLVFLAEGKYGKTAQMTDQESSFSYDPYNQKVLSAGIGLSLDIDWGVTSSRVETIKSEITQLRLKKSFAKRGVPLKVMQALEDLKASIEKVKHQKKSKRYAKKWLSRVVMAVSMGLLDSKKISDVYSARAMTFKSYLEAVYENYMAWASLSKLIGKEVDPLLINK